MNNKTCKHNNNIVRKLPYLCNPQVYKEAQHKQVTDNGLFCLYIKFISLESRSFREFLAQMASEKNLGLRASVIQSNLFTLHLIRKLIELHV